MNYALISNIPQISFTLNKEVLLFYLNREIFSDELIMQNKDVYVKY